MHRVFHFIRRKPHLTHAQFREHFERSHAAMAIRYFGHLFLAYRRHYADTCMTGGDPRVPDGGFRQQAFGWDLLSEWTTRTRADYEAIQQGMESPGHRRLFLEDEDRIIDRTSILVVPCTASHDTGTVFEARGTVFDTPDGEPSWQGWEAWQPAARDRR